jgi:hypothetical protein
LGRVDWDEGHLTQAFSCARGASKPRPHCRYNDVPARRRSTLAGPASPRVIGAAGKGEPRRPGTSVGHEQPSSGPRACAAGPAPAAKDSSLGPEDPPDLHPLVLSGAFLAPFLVLMEELEELLGVFA